jgi:hypothetical protein
MAAPGLFLHRNGFYFASTEPYKANTVPTSIAVTKSLNFKHFVVIEASRKPHLPAGLCSETKQPAPQPSKTQHSPA